MKLEQVIAQRETKTIYRSGEYAIKVFNEGYSKADILNEALNQARIEETGLPIPRIIEVEKVQGKWAIVSEFIEGKTITHRMEEAPGEQDALLEQFVDIQLRIHAQRSPLLTKLKDKMNRKISQADLDATTRYELHTRLEGMPTHDKVCHGDYSTGNVIITPEGEPYILDWAHATQGNASADAARSYLVFVLKGQEALAKEYMRVFSRKSDTARQYIESWLPIVAASQSVKSLPHERDLLLSWANVVDYE